MIVYICVVYTNKRGLVVCELGITKEKAFSCLVALFSLFYLKFYSHAWGLTEEAAFSSVPTEESISPTFSMLCSIWQNFFIRSRLIFFFSLEKNSVIYIPF